ncbi:hypothetical protein IAT40_005767 [Kwoniella sp. CBS 6097]
MSSKYQGLPDIDTAPDIFETPDEPDTLLRPTDNGLDGDDVPLKVNTEGIDSTGLPSRRKAERVFGRGSKRPDSSHLTFRPRLPPISRHASTSSSSSSSEDEYATPPTPRESTASRLRRLKAELAEVEAELANKPSTTPSTAGREVEEGPSIQVEAKRKSVLEARKPVDVLSELAGLKERLERVDIEGLSQSEVQTEEARGNVGSSSEWRDRLEKLNQFSKKSESETDGKTADGDVERDGQSVGENSLGGIDKRLAALEDALGPIGDGVDHSSPLIPTLNKHDHLLTLLTQPRHLDAISRRIKLLLVDLDRAAAASKRNPLTATSTSAAAVGAGTGPGGQGDKSSSSLSLSQAEYQNLQSLFSILPRLDPLLPILSPVLARLRSLNSLHAEASEVADSLRKLQGDDKRSNEQIGELKSFTEKVAHGLDEASEGILKNWDAVEGRLKLLDERLKSLESS